MKINTAVIGAGNMGRNHARIYSETSNLTAISDIDSSLGKSLANQYHAKFYKDYREMFLKENIQAVSVVVPTPFHSQVSLESLKLKIPTLVEKPISDSLENAKKMIEMSKKQKTVLMVGHIERFNPAIIALKKAVNSGDLGEIISLLAIRVGINPPKTAKADVSLDLAIHDIDVFNYLLDQFPKKKKIINHKIFDNNISDSSSIVLEYPKVTGMIQTNWITPIKIRKLFVTGTKGYCEVDYIKQKLLIYDKKPDLVNKKDYGKILSLSNAPLKKMYVSKREPLREELTYFLKHKDNYADFDGGFYAFKALEVLIEK